MKNLGGREGDRNEPLQSALRRCVMRGEGVGERALCPACRRKEASLCGCAVESVWAARGGGFGVSQGLGPRWAAAQRGNRSWLRRGGGISQLGPDASSRLAPRRSHRRRQALFAAPCRCEDGELGEQDGLLFGLAEEGAAASGLAEREEGPLAWFLLPLLRASVLLRNGARGWRLVKGNAPRRSSPKVTRRLPCPLPRPCPSGKEGGSVSLLARGPALLAAFFSVFRQLHAAASSCTISCCPLGAESRLTSPESAGEARAPRRLQAWSRP